MKPKTRYTLMLSLQFAAMFLLALITVFTRPLPILYGILCWFALPALGAFSTYICVTRGVNAYIAWIMPPLGATAAGFLASMGIAPDAGRVLLLAFASLVGAAAGDVRVKARAKGEKHK